MTDGGPYDSNCIGGRRHLIRITRGLARDLISCVKCRCAWTRPTAMIDPASRTIITVSDSQYTVVRKQASERQLAQLEATRREGTLRLLRAYVDQTNKRRRRSDRLVLEDPESKRPAVRGVYSPSLNTRCSACGREVRNCGCQGGS